MSLPSSPGEGSPHTKWADAGPASRCRLCHSPLPAAPLLTLGPAPRGAQAFVRADAITEDAAVTLDVRQCEHCGLIQLMGAPVPNWRHVIRSGAYSPEMRALRRRQFGHFLAQFTPRTPKVLEAGCGRGDLLEILRESGARPFGLEASADAVQAGRALGFSIELGYPASGTVIENFPFDAFVTVNVVEHAVDPRDFLIGLRENLGPEAVGLVEVPSFERMLEHERFYDFIADHLSYFTEPTLRLALETSGFEVLEVSRNWWPDDIVAFVRVRPVVDLTQAQGALARAAADIRAFVDRFAPGGSVAVWGASHQALTLLALAGADHVAYVIDSAPFKQGLFTPATHLPVVAPAHLESHPPTAILVMAAGYGDEVVRAIRRERGYRGTVGVLHGDHVELPPNDEGARR